MACCLEQELQTVLPHFQLLSLQARQLTAQPDVSTCCTGGVISLV